MSYTLFQTKSEIAPETTRAKTRAIKNPHLSVRVFSLNQSINDN